MSNNKTTFEEYYTGIGEIKAMGLRNPQANSFKGDAKEWYIRVELDANDPAVKLLQDISPRKFSGESNHALKGTGRVSVLFSQPQLGSKGQELKAPTVLNAEGEILQGAEIPAGFSSKSGDTGTAVVGFTVITPANGRPVVRLSNVGIKSINITEKENSTSGSTGGSSESVEAAKAQSIANLKAAMGKG